MNRNFLLLLFLGVPSLLFAQLDSFNLAAYKLPDIKTHLLDFNLSSGGSNSFRWMKSVLNEDTKDNSNDYSGTLGATYSYYGNREKYQGEQSLYLSMSANYAKEDPPYKIRAFSSTMTVHSVNRYYFTKKQFIEYDLDLTESTNNRRWGWDEYSNGNARNDFSISIPVRYGVGRIEQVQDARLAIYILEDLKKTGRITRVPDNGEILEFAHLISQTKNKRFFDSRIKRIWEIETIDAWLQSKNLIKSTDATYFTRLYDNWLYATGPVRESGRRFSIGLIPKLSSSIDYSYTIPDTTTFHPHTGYRTVTGVIRQERAKPVNLYWQTGHLFVLTGFWGQTTAGQIKDADGYEEQYVGLSGKIQYTLGWYPNSRTSLVLSFNVEGNGIPKVPKPYIQGKYHTDYDLYSFIGLWFHYYISPQLQLDLNYSCGYDFTGQKRSTLLDPFSEHTSDSGLFQSLHLTLFYSLF